MKTQWRVKKAGCRAGPNQISMYHGLHDSTSAWQLLDRARIVMEIRRSGILPKCKTTLLCGPEQVIASGLSFVLFVVHYRH